MTPPARRTTQKELSSARFDFWMKIVRDVTLFVLGVSIIVNEAWLRSGDERESILILAAGLVGMPFIFRAEEYRRNGNGT